nr:hypothetical protein [Tanacetum cinerariifolium]
MSIDPISQEIGSDDRPIRQETTLRGVDAQTMFETASKRSNDPPLSTGRVETFTDKSLGEDASKQASNDDQTEELNLIDGADTEVIVEDKVSGEKRGSTAETVSTARPHIIVARPEKAKEKRVDFKDVNDSARPIRSITTLQPLPTIDPKDKCKGVLVEEELEKLHKVKRRDQVLAQIESDADLAQRIYEEELAELNRAQKERQNQEEATIAALTEEFDEIQARMDVDHELAGEKVVDDFVPMDSKKEEKKSVETESKDKKGKRIKRVSDSAPKQKSSKKQKMMQEQESAKSDEEESADYKQENKELRMWLTVVSDEEDNVDPEILSTKYPIVDWESQILGNVDMEDKHVYKIIRENRNTSYHESLSSMLIKFGRQDLVDLHILVMKRFEDNTLEGYNLLLWGDLKMSELLNQKASIQGKVPSRYFNASFDLTGACTSFSTLRKSKEGRSYSLESSVISRVYSDLWDHIIVGMVVGGQDVICVKEKSSSTTSPADLRGYLEDIRDYIFSDGASPSLPERKSKDSKQKVSKVFSRMQQPHTMKFTNITETSSKDVSGDVFSKNHSKWLQTVGASPEAVHLKFVPITSLLNGVPGSGYLSHAINLYLRYKPAEEDL